MSRMQHANLSLHVMFHTILLVKHMLLHYTRQVQRHAACHRTDNCILLRRPSMLLMSPFTPLLVILP